MSVASKHRIPPPMKSAEYRSVPNRESYCFFFPMLSRLEMLLRFPRIVPLLVIFGT